MERKLSWSRALVSLLVVFLGNFIGTFLMTVLLFYAKIEGVQALHKTVANKVTEQWYVYLLRGITCNWLVNIALWQASSGTLVDKMIGILFPISAFVVMSGEHSIANMFLFQMAIAHGSNATVEQMVTINFLPVVLGNILSGVFLYGVVLSLLFSETKCHCSIRKIRPTD